MADAGAAEQAAKELALLCFLSFTKPAEMYLSAANQLTEATAYPWGFLPMT